MAENTKNKKRGGGGPSKNPPFLGLKGAFAYVSEIVRIGGQEGTFDVLTKVFNNKITSSGFGLKLAGLRLYGLISVSTENETYTLSPLAISYTHPTSENGQIQAIQTAFLKVPTLQKIWEAQRGKTLPSQIDFFANYLVQSCEVPEEAKTQWANFFIESGIYAKIIEERGGGNYVNLVIGAPTIPNLNGKSPEERLGVTKFIQTPIPKPEMDGNPSEKDYSRPLPSGKALRLSIPEEPTSEDAKEITRICNIVIKSVKGFIDET